MPAVDFLRDSTIRFLKQAAQERGEAASEQESRVQSDGGVGGIVWFQFDVSDRLAFIGEKSLVVVIADISESVIDGDGFRIVIPDIVTFAATFREESMLNLLSRLSWRDSIVGKFKIADGRSLRYELETVFPEGKADPDQVGVALFCAVNAIIEFNSVAAEILKDGDGRTDAGDWDIWDILARTPS